jgi:hypothetical protein
MSMSGDEDVERQGLTEKSQPPTPSEDTAGRNGGVHPAFFIV